MQIDLRTDNSIEGTEELAARVSHEISTALEHHAARITRVEVHLSDESIGRPTGNDIRCLLTADLEGQPPVVASAVADGIDKAVLAATHALAHAVEHRIGRLSNQAARRHA